MNDKQLKFIQTQIGYNFKNVDLLQQSFVRHSYAKENGGADNEILKFIGDKVLDIVVVKILTEKFGYMTNDYNIQNDYNEFYCKYSEGKLTEMKRHLIEKKILAHRIDMLGFDSYLIMGKGDVYNQIGKQESVKEDLFKAIIGAVTLDSQWDFSEIQSTIEVMLSPDSYLDNDNYVERIQTWTLRKNQSIPLYFFKKSSYESTWYIPFNGISQTFNVLGSKEGENTKYYCLLQISNKLPIFRGFGSSKSEARKAVCKLAYSYLEKNELLFSIQHEI